MVFWVGYVSDENMGTFAPIVVYWLYAGCYHLLLRLPSMEKYRLHSINEENQKNVVPLASVIKGVLFQQLLQAAIALTIFSLTSNSSQSGINDVIQPSVPVQVIQMTIAMLVMDAWQYLVHRYMHQNMFLYKHIHSRHHKLVVPYAIGALYTHPIESLVLDTCSGVVSYLVSGMTVRTSVVFFCFAVIKGIDDHCGLWLQPWNIFQLIFQNNTAYHDIHHQLQGAKYNFSLTFFPLWDKLLGTYQPYEVVMKPQGGFEVKFIKETPQECGKRRDK